MAFDLTPEIHAYLQYTSIVVTFLAQLRKDFSNRYVLRYLRGTSCGTALGGLPVKRRTSCGASRGTSCVRLLRNLQSRDVRLAVPLGVRLVVRLLVPLAVPLVVPLVVPPGASYVWGWVGRSFRKSTLLRSYLEHLKMSCRESQNQLVTPSRKMLRRAAQNTGFEHFERRF